MPFKPGQSGNPGGRAKLPQDVREAKNLNSLELTRVFNRFLYMTMAEIRLIIESPDAHALEIIAGRMMQKIAKEGGEPARLNLVLDRTCGKVKDTLDIHMKPYVAETSDGRKIVMGVEESGED